LVTEQNTDRSNPRKASHWGWLFLLLVLVIGCPVGIAVALPGVNMLRGDRRYVAPKIDYDKDRVDEIRSQIDSGDWE
jgi:hypothetical protein